MNSTFPLHADEELLLRLIDDELSPVEGRLVAAHLVACSTCRGQLEEIRETSSEYLQFHESVLKASVPPPPHPWKSPDQWSRDVRKTTHRNFPFAVRPWFLAAAAVGLICLVMGRLQHPPAVKAAELLSKAARAERTAPAHNRTIRIRAGSYQWDRPGRLPSARPKTSSFAASDASRIRQLLESADYSWDDPLSAEAFSRWHDHLSDKSDEVATLPSQGAPRSYIIHTTTAVSPISDALLTLRAADLHAVACTLRLRVAGTPPQTIDISEIPTQDPAPQAAPAHPWQPSIHPEPRPASAGLAGPGDELLAIAALHRIGADLGDPVEIRREAENVVVNVSGVGRQRQEQVKQALSGIDSVRVKADEPAPHENTGVERPTPAQVDTANPLLSELQAAMPDAVSTAEAGDQLIEHTENIIERVYALRTLARKFPPQDPAQMTVPQTAILNGIIRDHAAAIAVATLAIRHRLAPILPPAGPVASIGEETWQHLAQALLEDARRLDQALNATGTQDDSQGRKQRAAQALADIDQRTVRLRNLVRP